MNLNLQPGLHENVSEKVYHADELCAVPTLSCSIGKTIINQSPLHAWCEHPRLGGKRDDDPTSEMDFGSAAHKLCLGKGAELAVCAEKDWKKKDAQAFRDEARAAGNIPILEHKYGLACRQRDALMRQLAKHGDIFHRFHAAKPEVVVIFDDGPVRCRAMFDKLFIDEQSRRATIFDIKTTESANPKGLGRLIFNQHYDMQEASYTNGLGLVRPDLAGRIDFVFLFLETANPFFLQPAKLNGESHTLGVSKWGRAWTSWEACLRLNVWPGFSETVESIEPPKWGLDSEMGANPIVPKSSPAPQDLSESAKHAANSGESRARENQTL